MTGDATSAASSPDSSTDRADDAVPTTLRQAGAVRFWVVVALTGVAAGVGGAALTLLLQAVQHAAWPGSGTLVDAADRATALHHVLVLLAAGALTGAGQFLLTRLASGNGIDITAAIWFHAGRLPAVRTLGSAVLSIVIVAMGTSLGREGAPKQAGAVFADLFCNRAGLSDAQRRLLVACGAGAGMAAAYGVPLGGALFAVEVLRGALSLRLVLPAIAASLLAAAVSWIVLPDTVTYAIPEVSVPPLVMLWAVLAGPVIGLASVGFVRAVAWADRHKPKGTARYLAPLVVLGFVGTASILFPGILGNGKDAAELVFLDRLPVATLLALLVLKPLATVMCLRGGAPGGLFTPSLAFGALLGGALAQPWAWLWPGAPVGACAIVGAGAVLAATTQGPISATVLMMELTGHDRSFVVPLLLGVVMATIVARTIEPRSIYDARLTDAEVEKRIAARDPA